MLITFVRLNLEGYYEKRKRRNYSINNRNDGKDRGKIINISDEMLRLIVRLIR